MKNNEKYMYMLFMYKESDRGYDHDDYEESEHKVVLSNNMEEVAETLYDNGWLDPKFRARWTSIHAFVAGVWVDPETFRGPMESIKAKREELARVYRENQLKQREIADRLQKEKIAAFEKSEYERLKAKYGP